MEPTNNATAGNAKKMNPMIIGGIVVAVIIVAAVAVFAMRGSSNSTTSSKTPATSQTVDETNVMMNDESTESSEESMMEGDTMMQGEVKEFTLEAGSFYFKPNVIAVKKGDKVRVTINSVDMMHDFVIDEFSARTDIAKSGTSATVEFIADKTGSFEFYCSVGSHRAQGMVGTLTVE